MRPRYLVKTSIAPPRVNLALEQVKPRNVAAKAVQPAKHADLSDTAASRNARVTQIEVGRASRPFVFIKLANVFILWIGAAFITGVVAELVKTGEFLLADPAFAVLFVAYGFAAVIAWRNLGVLDAIVHPLTMTSLVVLALAGGLALLAMSGELAATNWGDRNSSITSVAAVFTYGGSALFALLAALAVRWARGRQIKVLNLRLKDLLERLQADAKSQEFHVRVPPKNALRGWMFLALGFAWLLGVQFIPDDIYFDQHLGRSMQYLPALGYVFLIYSRFNFQPDAEKLLAADKRPPILFLRSFADDERLNFWNFQRAETALFDFSLESRLLSHFGTIGPFVAIGSPQDSTPLLGASRVQLSDDEWQRVVRQWMRAAHYVIVMVGVTYWATWELSFVIARGYVGKLIVLFPEARRFRDRKKAAVRLARVREAFAGTIWKDALGEVVSEPKQLRSLVFKPDGGVVVVTSKARNRNSYHLAALISHYLLLEQQRR
jgi:hypothetical protein